MDRQKTHLRNKAFVKDTHIVILIFVLFMIAGSMMLLAPEPFNLIPFALILGIVFIVATVKYPMTGLFLYLIFYLIRPQELFPDIYVMAYPFEKFIAIFVVFSIVIHYLINKKKFTFFDIDISFILFIGAMGISVMGSIWITGAKDEFIRLAKMMAVFFLITRVADTNVKFKTVIWVYVISIGITAIMSSYNYYTGVFEVAMGIDRAAGPGAEDGAYSDPNSMASSLVLGIPFVFYMFKYYSRLAIKVLLIIIVMASLWTIIISGSRGGMLGAIVMLGFIAFNSKHRTIAIVVAVITIVGLAAVTPDQYMERFTSIADFQNAEDTTGAADSAQGRIRGLLVGFEILLTKPFTGVGLGCFGIYNYENHGSWLRPHNLLGQLVGEMGFLGLIAFSFFIYKLFSSLKYIKRETMRAGNLSEFNYLISNALTVSFFMLFFLGLFGHNLFRFNWYLFAGFIAIIAKLTEQSSQNNLQPADNHTKDGKLPLIEPVND